MIAFALLLGLAGDLPLSARVVAAGGISYALEDAEFVIPGAADASWSPDGKQLVVRYYDPPNDALGRAPVGQKEVVAIWSSVSRKFEGGSVKFDGKHELEFMWEGPSGAVVFQKDDAYYRLNAKGLFKLNIPFANPDVQTSRDRAGILVAEYQKSTGRLDSAVYAIAPNSTDPVKVANPEGVSEWIFRSQGGFYGSFNDPATRGKKVDVLLDIATGKWAKDATPPKPADPLLQVRTGQSQFRPIGPGMPEPSDGLWITGDPTSRYAAALLAPKSEQGGVSAESGNAYYFEGENLFVRKLSKMTAEQLDAVLEAEERMQLLSDVKQVGTGMLIYASDNDDRLPPAKGWDDAVNPYLKNRNLTDGFVYSYRGPEDLTKIENPAGEVVGYKEGRFGRAVVYADGHAKWEKRKA